MSVGGDGETFIAAIRKNGANGFLCTGTHCQSDTLADGFHLISVGAGDNAVSLQVDDDGIGFSVDEASKRRPGMGLFTMRERVGLVRGEFAVKSVRGKGTSVRVKIPVARDTFKPVEALVQ